MKYFVMSLVALSLCTVALAGEPAVVTTSSCGQTVSIARVHRWAPFARLRARRVERLSCGG